MPSQPTSPITTDAVSTRLPLLRAVDEESTMIVESRLAEPSVPSNNFRFSALFLGIIIGLFIQCSTLGANFVYISFYGKGTLSQSKYGVVLFSFGWSVLTSVAAMAALGFLRDLVRLTHAALSDISGQARESQNIEEMIVHMEHRFVVGALTGICAAWIVTDLVLGMQSEVIYSSLILIFALGGVSIAIASKPSAGTRSESTESFDGSVLGKSRS
jgi:hypothetical protein